MSNQVPDAGTGMMNRQRYGLPGEIYPCPRHSGHDCSMCGGSGYRSICNRTACHEHGCSFGTCGSTKEKFDSQERYKELMKSPTDASHAEGGKV